MSDVVLDANVIVGLLDEGDSLSPRAQGLVAQLFVLGGDVCATARGRCSRQRRFFF
jgi:hypothetical protein